MKALFTSFSIALLTVSCTSNSATSAKAVKSDTQPQKVTIHLPDTVTIKQKAIIPPIEGLYKAAVLEGDEGDACNLTVEIKKKNDKYFYILTLPGKVKKGAVTVSKSDDLKQFTCLLTLEGIKWASYEGNISNEDEEHPAKELEVPVGITMGYINNELNFQNDGNAMNAYTVIQECDKKYVRLVKQ